MTRCKKEEEHIVHEAKHQIANVEKRGSEGEQMTLSAAIIMNIQLRLQLGLKRNQNRIAHKLGDGDEDDLAVRWLWNLIDVDIDAQESDNQWPPRES